MLIVCTTDPVIADAASTTHTSIPWNPLYVLDFTLSQDEATLAMEQALQRLGEAEPLCFSAHGNNYEIGDADDHWGWTYADVARLLDRNAPDYRGHVLIHACATRIVNFSSHLAVELQNRQALNGTRIYGYKHPLPAGAAFPAPGKLAAHASLQRSHVRYKTRIEL